jgi:peptidoglycan/LPS O-acetylase OafA/YrhL
VVTPRVAADYVLRGLTLVSLEHRIPGAFSANPMPLVVNGPLWSLFHEVLAYALCFGAVRSGLTRRYPLAVAALALALWAMPGLPARLETFAPLFLAFAAGMTVWQLRALWPVSMSLAAGLALLAPLGWPFAVAALGQMTLILAFRAPVIRMRHDLSFGVYVYGWPVGQYLMHHLPGLSAPDLAVLTLLATLPFALTSWLLIEQPFLSFRPRAA